MINIDGENVLENQLMVDKGEELSPRIKAKVE